MKNISFAFSMKAKYFICVSPLPHKSDTINVSFFF